MNLKSTIASLRSLIICARFALIITLLVGGGNFLCYGAKFSER